ncbi:MAG: hypothetical protein ACPKM0_10745 [Pleomorphochaeta sp.]
MEEKYLFKKPLNHILNNKILLITLLFLIVLLFPLIVLTGAFLPVLKK